MGILRAWTRLEVVTLAGGQWSSSVKRSAAAGVESDFACASPCGGAGEEKRPCTLGSSPASCVPDQQGNISWPPPVPVPVRLGVGMKTEPQWTLSFSSWPSPDQDADLVTSHSSHNVYSLAMHRERSGSRTSAGPLAPELAWPLKRNRTRERELSCKRERRR